MDNKNSWKAVAPPDVFAFLSGPSCPYHLSGVPASDRLDSPPGMYVAGTPDVLKI